MNGSEMFGAYIGSNIVAVVLLLAAFRWPRFVRWIFLVSFLAAGLFNAATAISQPEAYLMYAEWTPVPRYRDFILGSFSQNTTAFVLAIALGQLFVGLLLAIPKRVPLALGVLGGGVFLAAIAPLGYGSGFPFSLIAIAALLVMYPRVAVSSEPAAETMIAIGTPAREA